MSHFIVTDRKTDYLLPPSLDDWLNEGNYSGRLARLMLLIRHGRTSRP